jgi:hypothetical protein
MTDRQPACTRSPFAPPSPLVNGARGTAAALPAGPRPSQIASVAPGAGLLDFLDTASAAAAQAVAPFNVPGREGPAARAQAAADSALDAAQHAMGMTPPPEGPAGAAARGKRLRGALGWAAVGAIALVAATSATPSAARRRAAAARTDAAPAAEAVVDARARPARKLGSPVLASAAVAAPAEAQPARAHTALDQAAAAKLLGAWHAARAAALGRDHDASQLAAAMASDLLVSWQQQALQTALRGE